jgi:WD40 repeat protein
MHAMSADGLTVASWKNDQLRAWHMPECEPVGPPITAIDMNDPALSADGKRAVASLFGNSVLTVWDLDSGAQVSRVGGLPGAFWHSSFSSDGSRVAVGMFDGTAQLFDADSGELLRVFRGHSREVERAILVADGTRLLTSSSDATARLWDVNSAIELNRFVHSDGVSQSTMSSDGLEVFTASFDGSARQWSAGGEEVAFIAGSGEVSSLAFSSDGTRLLSAAPDNIRLFDVATATVVVDASIPGVLQAALSESGDQILAVSTLSVAVLDATSGDGQVLRELAHSERRERIPTVAAFSPDGQRMLAPALGSNGLVGYFDPATGHIRYFTLATAVLSSDGLIVAGWFPSGAGVGAKAYFLVFDSDTGIPTARFDLGENLDRPLDVELTPDGTRLVSGDHDNIVRVRDIASGNVLLEMRGHTAAIRQVRVSADGLYALSTGDDGGARLWSLETGQLLRYFAGHDGRTVTAIAISPDGKSVALGSADGSVVIVPTSLEDTVAAVCARLGRELTEAERAPYGIEPSFSACP